MKERIIPIANKQLILFTGPEGSGKSTQGKLLAASRDVPYISSGDLLRGKKKDDTTSVGDAVREMFARGTYLDSKLLIDIVTEEVERNDTSGGVVFDGLLRRADEGDRLADLFDQMGYTKKEITVVNLRLPIWESMQRLQERGRSDDTVEGSLKRLGSYYTDLGTRMSSLTRRDWQVEQVLVHGKDRDTVHKEITQRLT